MEWMCEWSNYYLVSTPKPMEKTSICYFVFFYLVWMMVGFHHALNKWEIIVSSKELTKIAMSSMWNLQWSTDHLASNLPCLSPYNDKLLSHGLLLVLQTPVTLLLKVKLWTKKQECHLICHPSQTVTYYPKFKIKLSFKYVRKHLLISTIVIYWYYQKSLWNKITLPALYDKSSRNCSLTVTKFTNCNNLSLLVGTYLFFYSLCLLFMFLYVYVYILIS